MKGETRTRHSISFQNYDGTTSNHPKFFSFLSQISNVAATTSAAAATRHLWRGELFRVVIFVRLFFVSPLTAVCALNGRARKRTKKRAQQAWRPHKQQESRLAGWFFFSFACALAAGRLSDLLGIILASSEQTSYIGNPART